jgi:hypothetical protein
VNSSSPPADSTFPAGIDRTGIAQAQPHATPDEEFPQHQEWDGEPVRPAGDDLDLLAESGRKVTRITVILMAAILAGVAFLGGAVVQKQWGSTSSSGFGTGGTAAAGRAGGFGAEGGFGGQAGGFGGGAEGGFGGAAGGTTGGTTGGTGTQGGQGTGTGSTGSTGTSATPVVVGTVTKVSGRTLSVKNFGGKTITVKVPKGTTITSSSDSALSGLAKGASVSVAGSTASDGTVTATSITAK